MMICQFATLNKQRVKYLEVDTHVSIGQNCGSCQQWMIDIKEWLNSVVILS